MKDYYYIMFGSLNYDEDPLFLSANYEISHSPDRIKVFSSLEDAVDYKHKLLAYETYQQSYMFDYYEINIERF